MKSLFEETGGTYTLQGDYYFPTLTLPAEENRPIGIWGQRHARYLKQHYKVRYYNLLTSGKLNGYLADIDKQAEAMFSRLLEQMAEQKGVPFDKEGFDRSARQIGTQIKALLAQKLWGFNEYFVIMNAENDEVFAKALEVLKNWNQYGDSTGTVLPQKP